MSDFVWGARVYWEDTDAGGVVYYANYLKFLERARTEWLRSHGFSQQALAEDPGVIFPVVRMSIEYRRPARLDDELLVSCDPRPRGATAIRFLQRICKRVPDAAAEPQMLAEAEVQVACVDAATFRPTRLPQFLMNALGAPESE
ncbi:MAG TPA: tol-pal system-associated acyl-CoA thioesterase [Steroidobacteraceae bacterium]